MIILKNIDLRVLIATAYDLSESKGLGRLHYKEGPIPAGIIDVIMLSYKNDPDFIVRMDYVLGRAVKLNVKREADETIMSIPNEWFDHTPTQLIKLLVTLGANKEAIKILESFPTLK